MSFAAQYTQDIDESELTDGCVYWRNRNASSTIKVRSPVKRTTTVAQLPSPSTASSSKLATDSGKRLLKRRRPVLSSSAPPLSLNQYTLKCMDALEVKLASKSTAESPLRIVNPNTPRLRSHTKPKERVLDVVTAKATESPSRQRIDARGTLRTSLTSSKAFSPTAGKSATARVMSAPAVANVHGKDEFDDQLDGDDSLELALSQLTEMDLTLSQQARKDASAGSGKDKDNRPSAAIEPPRKSNASSSRLSSNPTNRPAGKTSNKVMAVEITTPGNPFQRRPPEVTVAKQPDTIRSSGINARSASVPFRPASKSTKQPHATTTAAAKFAIKAPPKGQSTTATERKVLSPSKIKEELAALQNVNFDDWDEDF